VSHHKICRRAAFACAAAAALLVWDGRVAGQQDTRFYTGVELVNVTATVTDATGRFRAGLGQSDFLVYEDGQPVQITHFSAERVPVSLGIVLDTSGSMRGAKIVAAQAALERFLTDLLGPDDEFFLFRFENRPHLVEGWTSDRALLSERLKEIQPDGATALYDAIVQALPLLRSGRHTKKALLVISDGNDTSSIIERGRLKQLIRESEALVYAIGMDAQTTLMPPDGRMPIDDTYMQRRRPIPVPFPIPGGGKAPPRNPPVPGVPAPGSARPPKPSSPDEPQRSNRTAEGERVNESVLRDITDDSGGRTELLRNTKDLDPATARIADELSKQYFLAYPGRGYRDGRWHSIRVETRDRSLRVRARKGYVG
jgi:VWFA-related protein